MKITQEQVEEYRCAQGNTKIKRAVITGQPTDIPPFAFEGCTNLRSVTLPQSIRHICVSAFENCTKLEHVNAPPTLVGIGPRAFKNCSPQLKRIGAVYVHKEAFNSNDQKEKKCHRSEV